jgi:hypothetical protein
MRLSSKIGACSRVAECRADSLLGGAHVHDLLLVLSCRSTRMLVVLGAFLK